MLDPPSRGVSQFHMFFSSLPWRATAICAKEMNTCMAHKACGCQSDWLCSAGLMTDCFVQRVPGRLLLEGCTTAAVSRAGPQVLTAVLQMQG